MAEAQILRQNDMGRTAVATELHFVSLGVAAFAKVLSKLGLWLIANAQSEPMTSHVI